MAGQDRFEYKKTVPGFNVMEAQIGAQIVAGAHLSPLPSRLQRNLFDFTTAESSFSIEESLKKHQFLLEDLHFFHLYT